MSARESLAEKMKLVGGRPCLDFANTVGGRVHSGSRPEVMRDKLGEFRDLALWGRHAGVLSKGEAARILREGSRQPGRANAVLRRAIRLREAIYGICVAAMEKRRPAVSDLETLNQELRIARKHEVLAGEGKGLCWTWGRAGASLDRPLWPIAIGAAELLTDAGLARLRQCRGENCGWLFEDTSKNRRRRWCDMRDCGNRAKVRRFRSRARRL